MSSHAFRKWREDQWNPETEAQREDVTQRLALLSLNTMSSTTAKAGTFLLNSSCRESSDPIPVSPRMMRLRQSASTSPAHRPHRASEEKHHKHHNNNEGTAAEGGPRGRHSSKSPSSVSTSLSPIGRNKSSPSAATPSKAPSKPSSCLP